MLQLEREGTSNVDDDFSVDYTGQPGLLMLLMLMLMLGSGWDVADADADAGVRVARRHQVRGCTTRPPAAWR